MRHRLAAGATALVAVAVWYAVTHFERNAPSPTARGPAAAADQQVAVTRLPALLPALKSRCGDPCGTERWQVKTLSDADRDRVSLQAVPTTVEDLVAMPRPDSLPPDGRAAPVELTTFTVTGCLGAVSNEADRDVHLVLGGLVNPRASLIAEIPHPECAGVCESGLGGVYAAARAALDSIMDHGAPSVRCHGDVPLVTVSGVGFFDREHGQVGAAPNGLELHPVLALRAEAR